MTARSRCLAWLMVPVLALCSLAVSANSPEGASQALHLIDYIGADYPPTVEDGKVIDETEYHEQLEFLTVLKGLIADLPERPERAELAQGVEALQSAIEQREGGAKVAREARQLGAKLGSLTKSAKRR